MLNYLIGQVRTSVPFALGLVVSWLLGHDVITEAVAAEATTWSVPIAGALVLLITSATYAFARLVEAKLPKLLAAVLPVELAGTVTKWIVSGLLGFPAAPTYNGAVRPAPPAR